MTPELKLPDLIGDVFNELPPDELPAGEPPAGELPAADQEWTLADLATIKNAMAELSLPYERLHRYFNSVPAHRDSQRLENIDNWRKEQRRRVQERRADAAKIGTEASGLGALGKGQRGAVVDQKRREKFALPENQKTADPESAGPESAGLESAGQKPSIKAAELKENAEQEKNAEQCLTTYRQKVARQAEEAEKKFWNLLPGLVIPPGMTFEPYFKSKLFTAPECLEFPLEDAARQWFQGLCEGQEVDASIDAVLQQKRSWQASLKLTARVRRRFRSAGSAWDTHVDLLQQATNAGYPLEMFSAQEPAAIQEPAAAQEPAAQDSPKSADRSRRGRKSLKASAAPENPMDWLVAWVAAEIGEQYLFPLMKESDPKATHEQMRRELTTEIWVAVLFLRAERLTVAEFRSLPTTAAARVRKLYSSASGDADRLTPVAKRSLQAAIAPAPDPLAAAIEAEGEEHLWERIRALPPRQRRCLELFLQEYSRDEMAEKMGCKPESVKEHLKRARKRLSSDLRPELIDSQTTD